VLNRCVENFFKETEQVAFCTQNIVPGIDFSNDPLLQGRNFSYLDTQVKRLGGPNFTHLPINAPKCPVHTLQQDGHMALVNPTNRANYEPNSWGPNIGGPREAPDGGFSSYPAEEQGTKLRIRAEKFADHYSQARQFYISQTKVEQNHIAEAFVFELSKVETVAIRARMVSHLLNVDGDLAEKVARGLALREMPKPAQAARPPLLELKESPALSIVRNGPSSFVGRKVGALISDGVDVDLLKSVKNALEEEGALLELIAPMVGGVAASDGSWIEADQQIDGGPSVLYDAVALLVSETGAELAANESTARDFVSDAFAHLKFVAYARSAMPLVRKVLSNDDLDGGFIELEDATNVDKFIQACRKLRFWERARMVSKV
jgi:catalase